MGKLRQRPRHTTQRQPSDLGTQSFRAPCVHPKMPQQRRDNGPQTPSHQTRLPEWAEGGWNPRLGADGAEGQDPAPAETWWRLSLQGAHVSAH